MNIKSLLLGSAAAAVAFTGAQAADAIIIAEPEPMEYVRICDTYGTGFFYIPGTENCMRIGGYVRYQMEYTRVDGEYVFGKMARFAPNFDVRNETEWGTLRSFAELEFTWNSPGAFTGAGTNLAHAFISLENGPHTFLVGKTDTPYHATSNAGWNAGGIFTTNKGNNSNRNGTSTGVVQYTFNAGNGFDATFAAVEPTVSAKFEPNLEAVLRYSQGWGRVMGAVGYDNVNDEWGGKLGAEVNFAPVTLGAQIAYGSDRTSAYGARYANLGNGDLSGSFALGSGDVLTWGGVPTSEWAVLGYARVAIDPKLSAKLSVQWFDGESTPWEIVAGGGGTTSGVLDLDDAWQVTAGLDWRPIDGLQIIPEVSYTKIKYDIIETGGATVSGKEDVWQAALRCRSRL